MVKKNTARETKENKKKRKIRKRWIIVSVIVLIIAFRLYLPTLVLNYVNSVLDDDLPGYTGHVEDIDLAIIRGAYEIHDIKVETVEGKIPVPFFHARVIDLSVEWKSLFKGKLVGEIDVINAQVNFVQGPTKETSQSGADGKDWITVVEELMPLEINRFSVVNSEIHYRDFHSVPKVDIYMTNLNALATNLRNTNKDQELLPSKLDATANTFGSGLFKLHMDLNPLMKEPTFDLNSEVKDVELVKLNDFLKAYGKFDVHKGTFGLYTEVAAKNGAFTGYTKPIIRDLDVIEWEKETEGTLHKLYETLIAGASELLENHKDDQIATRIPLSGRLDQPDINIWATIGGILKNAFIRAFIPALEGSVGIGDVGGGAPQLKEENKSRKERRADRKAEKAADKKSEKK